MKARSQSSSIPIRRFESRGRSACWIAAGALRELRGEAVQNYLRGRS